MCVSAIKIVYKTSINSSSTPGRLQLAREYVRQTKQYCRQVPFSRESLLTDVREPEENLGTQNIAEHDRYGVWCHQLGPTD
jgi:hypothetical protein